MRNLQKLLALVLALVMSLALVTVAGAEDYTDVAANADHAEAIDVMSAIGVINGYTDGTFKPEGTLTRAEAAKIVAYMLLGDAVEDLPASNPFTDVTSKHWASAPIAYLKNEGIVNGRTETTFDPSAEVNGYEFAKMLLIALGYQADQEGLTGKGYSINAAKLAATAGLNTDVTISKAALSRASAAQMAFNTLTADVVEYGGNTTVTTGDVTVSISGKANTVTNNQNDDYRTVPANQDTTQQFCERYFKDLVLNDAANVADDMGRPGCEWKYDDDSVGKYGDKADTVKVVDEDGKTVNGIITGVSSRYSLNGSNNVYINGVNNPGTAYSGTTDVEVGDIVELYMGTGATANNVTTVVITRYSVSKVTGAPVTREKDDGIEVRVPGLTGYVDAEKFPGYSNFAKDDVVYSYTDNDGVIHAAKAESFNGSLTSIARGTTPKYTISGTQYKVNGSAGTIASLTTSPAVYNTEHTYYVDDNGFIIYAEKVEDALSNYVVIQEIKFAQGTGGITGATAVEARLVKMDGTSEVVKVKSIAYGGTTYTGTQTSSGEDQYLFHNTDSDPTLNSNIKPNETFFTYKVNSDNEYELTAVVDDGDRTVGATTTNDGVITNGSARISGTGISGVAVDASTVFVMAKTSQAKEFNVYTGRDNVPTISAGKFAYVANKGVATYVYISEYEGGTLDGNSIFIIDANYVDFGEGTDADGNHFTYKTFKAVVDGDKYEEVKVNASTSDTADTKVDNEVISAGTMTTGLFTPTYDKNGVITKLTAKSNFVNGSGNDNAVNGYTAAPGTLVAGADAYSTTADVPVFFVDKDGKVTEMTVAELTEDGNDAVYVITTETNGSVADFVIITEVADDDVSLTSITITGGSSPSADATKTEQRITVASETQYTFEATAKGVGAKVTYSTDGSTYKDGTTTANRQITSAREDTSEDKTVDFYIKVTSVDGTEQVYKITLVTPKSGG